MQLRSARLIGTMVFLRQKWACMLHLHASDLAPPTTAFYYPTLQAGGRAKSRAGGWCEGEIHELTTRWRNLVHCFSTRSSPHGKATANHHDNGCGGNLVSQCSAICWRVQSHTFGNART